jgi:adenosylmethionine-8-amino-7-oxononanoate aminotransferase
MAEQASQIAFAHTSQFHSASAEKLAGRLLEPAPANFHKGGRVYFTSGGSEATETAIKIARQYYLERGDAKRFRVVSRRQSYHGSTLGAMSVSGNVARRAPYQPLLAEWGHIAPCFCYHCPFEMKFPECGLACAEDLNIFLEQNDGESVAAFSFEPVVGATLGAAVPPSGYVARIAEICRNRGILPIADEIMSGTGRTGKFFAVQHWNVEPDIILVGKGIASGYAPLGAVLVARHVVETFAQGTGAFQHGFTYHLNYAQIDLCGCVASFSCHGVCLSSRAMVPGGVLPMGKLELLHFLCIKSYARRSSAMKSCWYHWSEPVGAFPDRS